MSHFFQFNLTKFEFVCLKVCVWKKIFFSLINYLCFWCNKLELILERKYFANNLLKTYKFEGKFSKVLRNELQFFEYTTFLCLLTPDCNYRVRHLAFIYSTIFQLVLWQIISFILPPNEYGPLWTCGRLTENTDFGKKIIFSDEAHFDLGGYVNKPNWRICGTETHTLKSRRTHNEPLFGADLNPEA